MTSFGASGKRRGRSRPHRYSSGLTRGGFSFSNNFHWALREAEVMVAWCRMTH